MTCFERREREKKMKTRMKPREKFMMMITQCMPDITAMTGTVRERFLNGRD
jgi:hypothetical protein